MGDYKESRIQAEWRVRKGAALGFFFSVIALIPGTIMLFFWPAKGIQILRPYIELYAKVIQKLDRELNGWSAKDYDLRTDKMVK